MTKTTRSRKPRAAGTVSPRRRTSAAAEGTARRKSSERTAALRRGKRDGAADIASRAAEQPAQAASAGADEQPRPEAQAETDANSTGRTRRRGSTPESERVEPKPARRRRNTAGAGGDKSGAARSESPAEEHDRKPAEVEAEAPMAMPQAAPLPPAAAVPGMEALADVVPSPSMAGSGLPGLGMLPVPATTVPAPDGMMREAAEIVQASLALNVETLHAVATARSPFDLLQAQARASTALAEIWMRQAASLFGLYGRLRPRGSFRFPAG